MALGNPKLAADRLEDALESAEFMHDNLGRAWIHHELSLACAETGRETDAREHARFGLSLARSLGMGPLENRILTGTASVNRTSRLSARERQVLDLVGRGFANKEIAAELGISIHTAGNHIRHILEKLNCANRAEAAALALREGE
jgi:DNA-binding CsgD family transcriptional regulator